MSKRLLVPLALAVVLSAVVMVGAAASSGSDHGWGADHPSQEPDPGDDVDVDDARQQAHAVLGMNERDLPEGVRIARRGDEHFMLTEDHVLGRRTVDLEDDGSGMRVVSVVVELPDGSETIQLQAS